jgi:flagellar export protein FliJ
MQRAFKLQKVLDYRRLMLERETAQLSVLLAEEERILNEIKKIEAELDQKRNELEKVNIEADFSTVGMYDRYIRVLETRKGQIVSYLQRHRQEIIKQKTKTLAAYKRKTIMNKLADRHKRAYSHFIDKEEMKSSEDIVLTRKAVQINSGEEQ